MDWTGLIKIVAPWIGTALGGPLGGMAVEAAANALGVSDKTADAVKAAISGATPEQLQALKKADQDFALQMQALDFKNIADLEALAAADRKDARDLQRTTRSIMRAVPACGSSKEMSVTSSPARASATRRAGNWTTRPGKP